MNVIGKIYFSSLAVILMIMLSTAAFAESGADEYAGVHPRLLINAEGFARAADASKNELSDVYGAFIADCDNIVKSGSVKYYTDANREELWMRNIGNNIMKLAFAYKLSGDGKYRLAAMDNIKTAAGYPTWGRGEFENKDLAAAHLLRGIACCYDWLYEELTSDEKALILNTLKERGGIMAKCNAWWNRSYMQNHLWICLTSIMEASVAIYDDYPQALKWNTEVNRLFEKVFSYLPEDGSVHEGMEYWLYGMEFMLEYADMADKFYSLNVQNYSFIKNTGKFAAYMMLPELKTNGDVLNVLNFADCSERLGAITVSVFSRLADIGGDGDLKYFSEYIKKKNSSPKDMWQLLMYCGKTHINSNNSINYNNDKLFSDMGYAFMRTGWNEKSDVFALRCGACLGSKVPKGYKASNMGTGHVHPDVNHFILYSNGQRLISDDGYTLAYTKNHNTLSVDGTGQYGEGNEWKLPEGTDASPQITKMISEPDYTLLIADGTAAYTPESSVTRFVRKFIYLKEQKALLVIDDVRLSQSGKASEIRFFTDIGGEREEQNGWLFQNGIVKLRIESLTDRNGAVISLKNIDRTCNKAGDTKKSTAVCISSDQSSLFQITALTWADKSDDMSKVKLINQTDNKIEFTAAGSDFSEYKYVFNLSDDTLKKEKIFPFSVSVDYSENIIDISGALPEQSEDDVNVLLENKSGKTVCAGYDTVKAGKYNVSFALESLTPDEYTTYVYCGAYGKVLSKNFGIEAMYTDAVVKQSKIDVYSEEVCGEAVLVNRTPKTKNAAVFLAAYDSSGILVKLNFASADIEKATEKIINLKIEKDNNTAKYRIFVWNGGMKPLLYINETESNNE